MAVAQLACLLKEKKMKDKTSGGQGYVVNKHVRMSGYWLAAVFWEVCLQTCFRLLEKLVYDA